MKQHRAVICLRDEYLTVPLGYRPLLIHGSTSIPDLRVPRKRKYSPEEHSHLSSVPLSVSGTDYMP